MSFADTLLARIRAEGPMPLARAMALGNAHYYATRASLGRDFATAPEISQMFGELLAAWAVDLWARAGRPGVQVVELGPGRGTLMADMLRVFTAAGLSCPIHFVETSPRLKALQARAVPAAIFHTSLDTLPTAAPLLVFANEFLDALPITQFERNALGWAVRTVAGTDDGLAIAAVEPVKLAMIPARLRDAPPGSVFERGFAAEQAVAAIGRRVAAQGGAALLVDYGHVGPAIGDTLQAIRDGAPAVPLAALGEGDVTAHVDFAAIAHAGARAGARAFGVVDQGAFLTRLGLRERADRLKAGDTHMGRAAVEAAAARLAGAGAMGRLFKVMALVAPDWPEPAALPRFAQ